MKKRLKKLVGITMAAAMTISLLPATAYAEEPDTAEQTSQEQSANDNLLRLWYTQPATTWNTEALAIGNGYMGSLVYGGVNRDKIHLNEKTVWNGGPNANNSNNYTYGTTNAIETEEDLQKIKDNLQAIREKLDDKSQYVFGFDENSYTSSGTDTGGDAMNELNKLMGDLNGYAAPADYANLYITTGVNDSDVSNYVRDLDMRTGLATVNYDYDGVHYTREYFDSYPDNVMAVRLTADKAGKINFTTNLESRISSRTYKNTAEDDTITMLDNLSNGLKVEGQLKVLNEGGTLTSETDSRTASITVADADAVTLIFACGTDYKMEYPSFRGEDPHETVTERINAAAKKGYDALKEDHVSDHSSLFSRMEIGFDEEIPQIPTDELIRKYRNLVDGKEDNLPTEAEQRALEVMAYQFGRYLTIAGSREGSLPTNLQGVWGEGNFAWGGDYHFNINVQMNYWPTMASNLGECLTPYNDYLNALKVAGRYAAAAAFGIKSEEGEENGWLVGCFSTPYMFSALGQKNNAAGWNPTGSAWALLNSYEYYLYTEDTEFLKELYPSMKEVANFWNEALYWSEYQQRYVSAPSYSPENGPIVNGASYDQQFIWQHFENTIHAAEVLGVDEDLVATWKEKQSKLDPVLVGDDGQVKEWFEETSFGKAQAGDLEEINIPQWRQSLGAQGSGEQPPHRHLSHLMALYPGTLINKDNSEYMDAAMVSLNERGLDATGWSKAHKLNLWARTGHAKEAFQIVQSAVGGGNSGFLTNLFSSHGGGTNYKDYPIFQIDGNFGYTAGVNEMLLQSQLGYTQFLPALPDEWNTGHVEGIVARGNFVIDMNWSGGNADKFVITSRNGGTFTGEYNNLAAYTVKKSDGTAVETTKISDNKISFATDAGEKYTIDFNTSPEKLQNVIKEAKELSEKMTDDVLATQKEYLDNLIVTAEKVVEDQDSSKYYEQIQILNQAIKVGNATLEVRDAYNAAKEVYDNRDQNEDWASYVKTANDLKNQLDAAEELLKNEVCKVSELTVMATALDKAKEKLTGLWNHLTLTFNPESGQLEGEGAVEITSEFDDLQIRYTTDGNDPMWFSDIYEGPFVLPPTDVTVKAALYLGNRQMSDIFTTEYKGSMDAIEDLAKKNSSVTDEGNSNSWNGPANALDGKNRKGWKPNTIPATLTLTYDSPVTVNTVEIVMKQYYPGIYGITDYSVEYWNGSEWVAAIEHEKMDSVSRIMPTDEFTSNKIRLNIFAAEQYGVYVDAFRLFNLHNEVTTDKSALDLVIGIAQTNIDEGTVDEAIESVQESFYKVFEYAKIVSDNVNSSQKTIENTTNALIGELQKLGFKAGDKSQLIDHYQMYSVLNMDDYLDGPEKDAFVEALEAAKNVIDDGDAMQDSVTEADRALVEAAEALIKKADKSALQALVDSTADYKKDNYLADGWNTFESARNHANEILEKEDATQEEVDTAKMLLVQAMASLRYKADKSVLAEVIQKAKELDLAGYDKEKVATFKEALAAAEAVMANENLSVYEQPIVDGAVLDLQNAIAALTGDPENPSNPTDPSKPGNNGNNGNNGNGTGSGKNNSSGSTGTDKKTTGTTQNGGKTTTATNGKATKTGDATPMIPVAAGMILSMVAVILVLRKKRR